MSTELKKQIAALKQQKASSDGLQAGKASLFLGKKEAGNVDTSVVFEAAISGLKTLAQYDGRLAVFLNTVLHPSSTGFQRELKTKEENKKLDEDLNHLIDLLSLWIDEPNAHLVLEYLLRRYRVHEFNVERLLRSTVAAHDTKIFAKIVQHCKLDGTTWTFLSTVKETGSPLPRQLLIKRASRHPELVESISQQLSTVLHLVGIKNTSVTTATKFSPQLKVGAQKSISFFTAVIVELAAKQSLVENVIRSIYLYLIEGLKTPFSATWSKDQISVLVEWKNSCLMITAQMSYKTNFGGSLNKALSNAVVQCIYEGLKSREEFEEEGFETASTAFMVLIVLSQQGQAKISGKSLPIFYASDSTAQWIHEQILSQKEKGVNVIPLAELIVGAIYRSLTEVETQTDDKNYISADVLTREVGFFLQSLVLSDSFVDEMLSKVLQNVDSFNGSTRSNLQNIARFVSHYMPVIFDKILAATLKHRDSSSVDQESLEHISQFLSQAFNKDDHHMLDFSGDSLFTALNSPLKIMRIQALEKISTLSLTTSTENFPDSVGLAAGAMSCMVENEYEVAKVAFRSNILLFVLRFTQSDEIFAVMKVSWSYWMQYASVINADHGIEVLNFLLHSLSEYQLLGKLLDNRLDRICWVQTILVSIAYASESLFEALQAGLGGLVNALSCTFPAHAIRIVDKERKDSRNKNKNLIVSKDDLKRGIIASIQKQLEIDDNNADRWTGLMLSALSDYKEFHRYYEMCYFGICSVLLGVSGALEDTATIHMLLEHVGTAIISRLSDPVAEINASLIASYLNSYGKARRHLIHSQVTYENVSEFIVVASNVNKKELSNLFCLTFLQSILLSKNTLYIQSFGKAIHSFFPTTYLATLLHLIVSDDTVNSSDRRFLTIVGLEAWRIYGLQIMEQKLSEVNASIWIIMTVSLILFFGGHSDLEIRSLTLLIADDLLALTQSRVNLTLMLDASVLILNMTDLESFLKDINSNAGIIRVEPNAIASTAITYLSQEAEQSSLLKALWQLTNLFSAEFSVILRNIGSIVVAATCSKMWSLDHIKHILDSTVTNAEADLTFVSLLVNGLATCFRSNAQSEENILGYMVNMIKMPAVSSSLNYMKESMIKSLKFDLSPFISAEYSNRLFQELLPIYLEDKVHQNVFLELFSVLTVDQTCLLTSIQEYTQKFLQYSTENTDSAISTEDDIDDNAFTEQRASSILLMKLFAILEVTVPMFLRLKDVDISIYSTILYWLFSILREVKQNKYRVVLAHEFIRMQIVEYICILLVEMKTSNIIQKFKMLLEDSSTTGAKVPPAAKKRGGKGATNTSSANVIGSNFTYSKDQVVGDTIMIMQLMGEFKQQQAHQNAFSILEVLLKLHDKASAAAIEGLGQLLSSSQFSQHVSREKFLTGVLEVLLPVLTPSKDDDTTTMSSGMQLIVQNLCQSLPLMTKLHRKGLLKTALKVLHDRGSQVFLIVHTLLLHTIANYEREYAIRARNHEEVDTICISKASQRRAQRLLYTSAPEEFFQLSLSLLFVVPYVDRKLEVLLNLISTANEIVQLSVHDENRHDHGQALINVEQSLAYTAQLSVLDKSQQSRGNGLDYAATLAILHIEYVLEVLENKEYHVQMAKYIAENPDSNVIQANFLELADNLLQLINYIDYRKRLPKSAKDGNNSHIKLRLEEEVFPISHNAYMDVLMSRCTSVLQSLQLMFDAPTFISIFQELLQHEVLGVRQKVMLVLRERLTRLMQYERPNLAEVELYMELSSHVRDIIRGHAEELKPSNAITSGQTALAQSAIMCLDILVQLLGGQKAWTKESNTIIEELCAICGNLYKEMKVSGVNKYVADVKKLLGSLFLCIATTCRVLGAGSLPHLPALMELILTIFADEMANLNSNQAEKAGISRSDLLFLQSLFSTVTVIIISLPSFIHPHLAALLSALRQYSSFYYGCLGSHSKDRTAVLQTVDICITSIGNHIPPRLLLPIILANIEDIFKSGHLTALKFVQMIKAVAEKAERNTVVTNMAKWLSLSTVLLDYRRLHGDHSKFSDAVEAAIHSALCELCLKFTETELKAFMTQINDWKNGAGQRDELKWTKEARFVSYYGLQQCLLEKLQHLYYSTMSLFWHELPETLKYVAKIAKKAINSRARNSEQEQEDQFFVSTSSAKKRKRSSEDDRAADEEQRSFLDELTVLTKAIMICLQGLCNATEISFMSEDRYESVASVIVDFLPLRKMFLSDTYYLEFITETLSPALTSVTGSISKDLLWKPINHQILMLMRSNSAAVKRAAINILKELFTQVGDEYTSLLPECLPFISELLEDENSEVIADTRRAIAAIEEMTGEKLDELLS